MRLPRAAVVRKIEVDTGYFKGNYPAACSLEAGAIKQPPRKWQTLLAKTPLSADKQHFYDKEVCRLPPVEMVRLRIYPDGGVSGCVCLAILPESENDGNYHSRRKS